MSEFINIICHKKKISHEIQANNYFSEDNRTRKKQCIKTVF